MVFEAPVIVTVPAFATIVPPLPVDIFPATERASEVGIENPEPLTARFPPTVILPVDGLNEMSVPVMVRLLKLNVPPPVMDLLLPLFVTVPVVPVKVPEFEKLPAMVSV